MKYFKVKYTIYFSIIFMILLNVDDFFRPGEQNCKIPDIFSMAFLYLGTQKHSQWCTECILCYKTT